ncbi:DUF4255 domain-containing protein [Oceanospirillum sediminis]|uniref:DUF4255 domain-containing protein n=1 Tax=Oceanospirillum sediminis TaxID=2760088 RepID=A0A839IRT9_9GAMM|nr:DUF4255 domain-containing protein [Oceanospirillum sediminis]
MIYSCLKYIAARLNQNLKHSYQLTEDVVLLADLNEQTDGVSGNTNNKITITLANIERDATPFQRQADPYIHSGQRALTGSQPLYINISVVIAAHFTGTNYPEALKFISHVMAFFHRNPLFDRQNSPDLPVETDRIFLEIENIQRHDLNSMWSMLGSRYLPSVAYRIRLAIPDSEAAVSVTSGISTPDTRIDTERGR